jgi:hypothetical protein
MGTDHVGIASLNLLVLILLFGLVRLVLGHWHPTDQPHPKAPRPLKPKSAADCPFCQAAQTDNNHEDILRVLPRPWRESRSPRGRKKESTTEGYACDNPACVYHGITDQSLHALVADGTHGKYERIQDLLCQACGHKFTVRRHTVLYRLKAHSARVAEALTFLAEGVDISALERVLGIGEGSLHTWLTRAGLHAEKLHAHFFQGLHFQHIQLDELWANVRQESQEVWLWAAMEVTTKIVPVIHLGPRTLEMAYAVVHELCERMQLGLTLPVFSSDGLRLYFYALAAHFGHWILPEGGHKRAWQIAADFIYGCDPLARNRQSWRGKRRAGQMTSDNSVSEQVRR